MRAPTLATERLIMRGFKADDVSAIAEIMLDKEAMSDLYAMTGVPDEPVGFAAWLINDAITSWTKSGFGNWAICTNSPEFGTDHKVIGFAGFLSEELLLEKPKETLEVGWCIHPEFSGKGLATEACVAVLEYGFDVVDANRILAITSQDNLPSRRLMERLAMNQSKCSSPYGYDDCVLYAVTKEEWKK